MKLKTKNSNNNTNRKYFLEKTYKYSKLMPAKVCSGLGVPATFAGTGVSTFRIFPAKECDKLLQGTEE